MKLPRPVQAYFEADGERGSDAPVHAFASDAVVTDEGQSHVGHEAIRAWWGGAKARYQHIAELLELQEEEGVARARARVTGQFPGSPVTLSYVFRLGDDQITALEIGA